MQSIEIAAWRFQLGDAPDAWARGFDDSGWRDVTVPHDWSVELPFAEYCSSGTGYLPGGVGWYRARVPLTGWNPADGGTLMLRFFGIYKNARVWVNGYHLGGRPSGHAEFAFDLSEIAGYAKADDLVISVRVEHTDISDSRWYNGSGITRQVVLERHQPVRVAEYGTAFTTLAADAESATIRIVQTLVNTGREAATVVVRHELRSLTSGVVQLYETSVDLPEDGSETVEVTGAVQQPELWSDTAPNLYRLTTTLEWQAGGRARQASYAETVGIRTFRFDAETGFSINGARRKLKGVCLHEDAGCLGTAVPLEVWLRRLLALKAAGCNGVRMAHNPHARELYALCDLLGFFVIDEAFDEWENAKNKWWQGHNVYPPRHQGYAKDFPDWHERDLVAMIDAHRNHPSIIAWSIGNEIDYPNDPYASPMFEAMTGNNDANKSARQRAYDPDRPDAMRLPKIARRLIEIVRRADATRPVTLAAAFPELSRHTGFFDGLDVIGYNYKEHLYEADHAALPDRPLLGSENSHRYADWRHAADKDYIAGQFLWTGIDYLGEARGWPVHGSGAGLLDLAGFDKPIWHVRRSWWADEPVARMVTRPYVDTPDKNFWSHPVGRDWGDADGTPIEVLCFANGEARRLRCGDRTVELAWDETEGWWTAVVPARAEPLVLEVLRDDVVVTRDELVGRGTAVRLEAVIWEAPPGLLARCAAAGISPAGIVQVECVLRDAAGTVAADERLVTARVEGGRLLGLENGDLADNAPYAEPTRRTMNGRLIVYVRPDEGRAVLHVTAEGLPAVEVVCGQPG